MRTDPILSLKIRRYVPLQVYTDQIVSARLQRQGSRQRTEEKSYDEPVDITEKKDTNDETLTFVSAADLPEMVKPTYSISPIPFLNIDGAKNLSDLEQLWNSMVSFSSDDSFKSKYNEIMLNKLMTKALELEEATFATDIFEAACNFNYDEDDPADSLLNIIRGEDNDIQSSEKRISIAKPQRFISPNNYLCTTAVKAYGRQQRISAAWSVFQWFDCQSAYNRADVYLLTALLYVCAKVPSSMKTAVMHYQQADRIFYEEFPRRGLNYSIPVINSMMYMHAKRNKPDEVIKLYDMARSYGLQSSIATFGVIIKALLRSRNPALERKAFEILSSIPSMGLEINAEIFNQVSLFNRLPSIRKID